MPAGAVLRAVVGAGGEAGIGGAVGAAALGAACAVAGQGGAGAATGLGGADAVARQGGAGSAAAIGGSTSVAMPTTAGAPGALPQPLRRWLARTSLSWPVSGVLPHCALLLTWTSPSEPVSCPALQ